MKFTIITPTTGHPALGSLLTSVNSQVYRHIEHIIVVDGPEFKDAVDAILPTVPVADDITRHVVYLPSNTGRNYYYGHRIYAAFGMLCSSDYTCFVDEDNTIEPNHISSFFETLQEKKYQWMFCLRSIYSPADNEVVCNDDCESLGHLMGPFYNPKDNFVDTNCYCISSEVLSQTAYLWNRQSRKDGNDADRVYAKALMIQYPLYTCTRLYTLRYAVGNQEMSVQKGLFLEGNKKVSSMYGGQVPWQKPAVYLCHINVEETRRTCDALARNVPGTVWADILRPLAEKYVWLSVFDSQFIPTDSTILVLNVDHLDEVTRRSDLTYIVHMLGEEPSSSIMDVTHLLASGNLISLPTQTYPTTARNLEICAHPSFMGELPDGVVRRDDIEECSFVLVDTAIAVKDVCSKTCIPVALREIDLDDDNPLILLDDISMIQELSEDDIHILVKESVYYHWKTTYVRSLEDLLLPE